jgi:hypothetical protein
VPGQPRHGSGGAGFDDIAEVHHGDAVTEVLDHGEVMGDEEIRESSLVLEIVEEVDHLSLDRDIERTDRFVADDKPGFDCERAGDADALALAAAEFVRVPIPQGRIEANVAKQLGNAVAPGLASSREPMNVEGFADDGFDGEARVEGTGRVLEDHLKVASLATQGTPFEGCQINSIEADAPTGGFEEPHDGTAECGFAAAAFADQSQGFTGRQLKVDTVNGSDEVHGRSGPAPEDREVDLKIGDLEELHGSARA